MKTNQIFLINCKSKTEASSASTSPTRKCCCRNSALSSAKQAEAAPAPPAPTKVDTSDDWLVDEDTDGDGDGDDTVDAVELHAPPYAIDTADADVATYGTLSATKCSWLHTTRKKSSCGRNLPMQILDIFNHKFNWIIIK